MTAETARLLAIALQTRNVAADGLLKLLHASGELVEIPPAVEESMRTLASTFVHEQRIVNRIVHEDVDD